MTQLRKKTVPKSLRGSTGRIPGGQRQRLIDASISALHLYGPSRTTVEKVVSIAKMSPGIVRFYFDSKAAMLVASLQFLASEFDERLMVPVAKLKATPIAALQLLVDLYLDPDIASPRKVSVWYAFWGEASSRQEYYDICGHKDASFAVLVRELIEALIDQTAQTHLDPDGVALGLIGVLEILWQDIAFQSERDLDRPMAKRRCMAYLNSLFPGRFHAAPSLHSTRLPGWVYRDRRIFAAEREILFKRAWTLVGHERQIPQIGDFFNFDMGVERVIVVRDSTGVIQALRDSCPVSPHSLIEDGIGRFSSSIVCTRHALSFTLGGQHEAGTSVDLARAHIRSVGGLLFVKPPPVTDFTGVAELSFGDQLPQSLEPLAAPSECEIAADWKVLVESWLEPLTVEAAAGASTDSLAWNHSLLHVRGWSAGRYARLFDCRSDASWRRRFFAPNLLMEIRPDGLSMIQVLPIAPGHCVVHRFDYSVKPDNDRARAVAYLARRIGPYTRPSTVNFVQSIQQGRLRFGYEAIGEHPNFGVDWFRQYLTQRIPLLESSLY